MSSPVKILPSPARLASRRVDASVSSAHGRRHAQMLNHLRAYAVSCVADVQLDPYVTSADSHVYVLYQRTPGVQVAMLTVQLHRIASGGSSKTATLSVEVGTTVAGMAAAAFVGAAAGGAFGGVGSVFLPARTMRQRDELVAFLDVSAFDPADVMLVRVTYVPAVTSELNGLARVTLTEAPLANVNPASAPTTEPGCNEAEVDVRNKIYQGTTGGPGGLARTWGELDVARSEVRQHLQMNTPAEYPFTRNAMTIGQLNWGGGIGTTWDLQLRGRARRRFGAGSSNAYKLWLLYSFEPTHPSGLADSYFRVGALTNIAALGGATVNIADLPLQDTTGSDFVLDSVSIDAPTDGTDQRFEVQVAAITKNTDGVTPTSDELRVAAFALIEDEA